MSLIVTIFNEAGIVMGSDGRFSLICRRTDHAGDKYLAMIPASDSMQKVFVWGGRIGISACGEGLVRGVPLAVWIQRFVSGTVAKGDETTPRDIAGLLLDFFAREKVKQATQFHVAGMANMDGRPVPSVWTIDLESASVQDAAPRSAPGVIWGGDFDVLQRLFVEVKSVHPGPDGHRWPLPQFPLIIETMTADDMEDFVGFALKTTVKMHALTARDKTVGGKAFVLSLDPTGRSAVVKDKAM